MAAWEFEFYLRVLILVNLSNDNRELTRTSSQNICSRYFNRFLTISTYVTRVWWFLKNDTRLNGT